MDAKIEYNRVPQTIATYNALNGDANAYVSVTSWNNGEGFDVELNEKGCQSFFQMTHGQWAVLRKTMKAHAKENRYVKG